MQFGFLWIGVTSTVILIFLTIMGNLWFISYPPNRITLPTYIKSKEYFKSTERGDDNLTIPDPYVTLSPDKMRSIKFDFKVRRERLERFCNNVADESSAVNVAISKMIVDTKHGISWCPVYKAASSAWMKHFAVLGGIPSDTMIDLIRRNLLQANTIVRQVFPKDLDISQTLEKLNQTKKFLIVRHPFERLLSAYRDKLEHIKGREYYYKRFGRYITHRYRREKNVNETKLEPTFIEFLQFIAKEKYFDEHWAPYYDTCKPCAIHYDYILKFETFSRDQDFLIREVDLSKYLYGEKDVNDTNLRKVATSISAEKYFKDVPKSLLKKVHKIYEKDFKLFSYLPMEYYIMSARNKHRSVNKRVV